MLLCNWVQISLARYYLKYYSITGDTKVMYYKIQVAFGTDFTKIWTAESLGIEVPEESRLNVLNYAINSSLQALELTFTSIYPPLNQVEL